MYFVGVAKEERIAKFNYLERQQGLEMIEKISNGDMDSATLDRIQENPRLAEIYETVSDPNMRKIFKENFMLATITLIVNLRYLKNGAVKRYLKRISKSYWIRVSHLKSKDLRVKKENPLTLN